MTNTEAIKAQVSGGVISTGQRGGQRWVSVQVKMSNTDLADTISVDLQLSAEQWLAITTGSSADGVDVTLRWEQQ